MFNRDEMLEWSAANLSSWPGKQDKRPALPSKCGWQWVSINGAAVLCRSDSKFVISYLSWKEEITDHKPEDGALKIKLTHPDATAPVRATDGSGAYDLFMPEPGRVDSRAQKVSLGFAMEVPAGHVALIVPRSSMGFKHGLELNNTCGVIDSDYRGEVFASMRLKQQPMSVDYQDGDRLLQMLIVPVHTPDIQIVNEFGETERGVGGIGSTGR